MSDILNPYSPGPELPEQQPPEPRSALIVRIARAIGLDRAVGYAVLAKAWQLLTGPVTQILIVLYFSSQVQGYYHTFVYLLGMQIFVELGLHIVIISLASHEWAALSFDGQNVQGDTVARARLHTICQRCCRWYAIAAFLFVVIVGLTGFLWIEDSVQHQIRTGIAAGHSQSSVSWHFQWSLLVLLTGLQLPLLPATSMLEACGQLSIINRCRFFQAVAGTIVVWTLIATGCGLWAVVGSSLVRLIGEAWLTRVRFRPFFESLQRSPELPAESSGAFDWRKEVLPLQWRIAVQGILLWFVNSVPGLVVFRWHGDVQVAKLGMTWTILTALQSASLAWIETRRPQFGQLIAAGRYRELDLLFFRMTRWAVGLMAAAGLTFLLIVWWMGTRSEWLFVRLSDRMLPPVPTAAFLVAMVALQFAVCTSVYVRAHKQDPFLLASIMTGLIVASLEILWGKQSGPAGVAFGYLLGICCVQVPLWTTIWWRFRNERQRLPVTPMMKKETP